MKLVIGLTLAGVVLLHGDDLLNVS